MSDILITFKVLELLLVILSFSQAPKSVMSFMEKETNKQNNVEKFEMREPNKNKTEAKWKYKVRHPTSERAINLVFPTNHTLQCIFNVR